jgi:hypothetical protein
MTALLSNDVGIYFSGPGNEVEWHDMLILCDNSSDDSAMVKVLDEEGVPVAVLTHDADEEKLKKLALAAENEVVVTDLSTAAGLERKVVVGMEQTIVTYLCHMVGGLPARPLSSLLLLVAMVLMVSRTPNELLRRCFVAAAVVWFICLASVAQSLSYMVLNRLYSNGPRWPLLRLVPGAVQTLLLLLIFRLVDEESKALTVFSVFCVAAASIATMSAFSTGLTLVGLFAATFAVHVVRHSASVGLFLGDSLMTTHSILVRSSRCVLRQYCCRDAW